MYDAAEIKPVFVQNRFYDKTGHDKDLRNWLKEHGIRYQSFWTLTANPKLINHKSVLELALKYEKTKEQIFYRFVQQLDIVPLSGTTSQAHMVDDLSLDTFNLESNEIKSLQTYFKI